MIETLFAALQMLIGIVIVGSSTVLLAVGCDKKTKITHRIALVGLTCWGVWFAWLGFAGHSDSLPALAFAAAIAYVLVFHGRQVRGIIEGERWWHSHKLKRLPR